LILDYSEYLKYKAIKGIVNFSDVDDNIDLFNHKSICPFCKKQINTEIYSKSKKEYPEWLFGSFYEYEKVIQCYKCGWWEYEYKNQSDAILDGIRASDLEYCTSIMRRYKDNSIDVPVNVLKRYINENNDKIYKIHPNKMEELVRAVLSDFYPNCKVKCFGKTRDGGKDGVIIDNNGDKILIQVKRRQNKNSTESVDVLRELIGVSVVESNVKGCIFVSTADHFSKSAKEYANKVLEVKHIEKFDLIDCKEFLKMLDLKKESLPTAWEKLLRL
jgi:hypothetical protein